MANRGGREELGIPLGDAFRNASRFDIPPETYAPPVEEPEIGQGFDGSSLNTLYGIDSESYLTDDQRKLARMIQGKFDASVNRRDRALAQYGAPRLSSYVEDEALARAMSLARGLNYKAPDALGTTDVGPNPLRGFGGPGAGGGANTGVRGAPAPEAKPPPEEPPFQKWKQIISGLASLAPLLFGKDAYGEFLNKGLLGTIKEKLFGSSGQYMTDQSFENLVKTGNLPGLGDPNVGGYVINPVTGMPMAVYGNGAPDPYADIYGPGSGWGDDIRSGLGDPAPQWGDGYGDDGLGGGGPGSDWGWGDSYDGSSWWDYGSGDYGVWGP